MTQITTDGSKMELWEIKKTLQEDGLDPAASDDDKMRHLWQIYQTTQSDLEELRGQQADEMKEVENYVEHIRTLSEERESLTVELEAENERLKEEAEHLKVELEGYQNNETKEMLLQQGLEDIADGSASEQVAYLLVERARLLDEIEAEQTQSSIQTPDGMLNASAIYKLLEQEREDFEDELQTQRENMRAVKEQMRHLHEEEISGLMEENEKLQNLLDETKEKINVQDAEFEMMRKGLDQLEANALRIETPTATTNSGDKVKVKQLQEDNRSLVENTKTLTLELQTERENGKQRVEERDFSIEKLGDEVDLQRQQIELLEAANQKSVSDKKSLEIIISTLERDLEDLHARERELASKNKLLQLRGPSQSDGSQSGEATSELQSRNRSLSTEVQTLTATLKAEKETTNDLEMKIKRIERTMDENRREKEQQEELLKSKIRTLEAKCTSLETELSTSNTQIYSTQSQHRQELEDSMSQSEKQLREVKGQLREVNMQKEDLILDLDQQKSQNTRLQREVKQSTEQVLEMEKEITKTERESRDLKHKLTQLTLQLEEKEEHLTRERNRNNERAQDGDSRLAEAHRDLDTLRQELKQMNSDMTQKDQKSLETRRLLETELSETKSRLNSMKRDLDTNRLSSESERDTLNARIQQFKQRNTQLEDTVTEYELESLKLHQELSKVKASERKLESDLELAESHQSDLEQRNSRLELETQRTLQQLEEKNEKNLRLENANHGLQDELARKSAACRELETMLTQRQGDQDGVLKMAQTRADSAERRLYDLQSDLEEAMSRLQRAEQQVKESTSLRHELLHTREENTKLQNQLMLEQQNNRSVKSDLTDDGISELSSMREREREIQRRNHELEHLLVDVEARIETMKNQTQSASDLRQSVELSQRNMTDHATLLQAEIETLKLELLTVSEKYRLQIMRYNERKMRTKNKLQQARDVFNSEKAVLKTQVEKLEGEVAVLKGRLVKDQEWKQEMETSHQKLMEQNRTLQTQLAEEGEASRDAARGLSMLQVRCKYLEGENNTLLQRLDSVSRQKHNLDRMLKEYQSERSKENAYKTVSPQTMAMLSPRIQRQLRGHLGNQGLHYGSHDNQSLSDNDTDSGSDARSTCYDAEDIAHDDDVHRGIVDDASNYGYKEGGVPSSRKSDRAGYVYLSSGLPRHMSEDDARSNASVVDL